MKQFATRRGLHYRQPVGGWRKRTEKEERELKTAASSVELKNLSRRLLGFRSIIHFLFDKLVTASGWGTVRAMNGKSCQWRYVRRCVKRSDMESAKAKVPKRPGDFEFTALAIFRTSGWSWSWKNLSFLVYLIAFSR
jgi:hypothetical protein